MPAKGSAEARTCRKNITVSQSDMDVRPLPTSMQSLEAHDARESTNMCLWSIAEGCRVFPEGKTQDNSTIVERGLKPQTQIA